MHTLLFIQTKPPAKSEVWVYCELLDSLMSATPTLYTATLIVSTDIIWGNMVVVWCVWLCLLHVHVCLCKVLQQIFFTVAANSFYLRNKLMSYWVIHQIQLFTTELEPHLRWKMISHYSLFHAYSECIHAHTLPLWGWETTHAHTILALILNTVDAEIFVGEIFRGLNFQEIQFLWMVAPTKFWTQWKFLVCEKFQCRSKWPKQSRSTRLAEGSYV